MPSHFFIPTAACGNGLSLATFGRSGEIMGFYYPRIDFAQNVREGMPAVRLLEADEPGRFLWCFADCWRAAQSFERAGNVLITRLTHAESDLSIELSDVLPPGERALLRHVVITKGKSTGPVQFVHYFRLAVGDVATRNAIQAYPDQNVIVQHYRDISLAVSASEPFRPICGGHRGEYRRGEESATKKALRTGAAGSLEGIGLVDFAVCFEPATAGRWEATLVLAGGQTREAAMAAARRLSGLPHQQAVRQANERVDREMELAGQCTVPELTEAFERAVISLHDLYDQSQGTFIAAPEFDPSYEYSGGYGYCWPRDAVVCALVMHSLGRTDITTRFFEWSARTQLPDGHWYQRYWTDGSPAPSWCVYDNQRQLDQTCAVLHAAGVFARRLGAAGSRFVKSYRPVAERAARAILNHFDGQGLHRPARDLWECAEGVFPYTQAGMIAALREADEVFGLEPNQTGPEARAVLRRKLIETFWQPDRGCWLRRITPEGQPDPTLDSSVIGLIDPWAVLDLADPEDRHLALETVESVSQNLRSEVKGGSAILRFENESYMGGGPGCVNTLWLALCRLRLAATATDPVEYRRQRSQALRDIRVVLANTSPTGQLPELIPRLGFDYWAAPHAWACALLIEAVLVLRSLDSESSTTYEFHRARIRRRAPS